MSTMRLNTKNINKKFLTVIIAVALLLAAGAVALGLSLNSKSSEEAQASISYTAGNLKTEVSPGNQQLVFLTIEDNPSYEVKAAWAYYTKPVSGKLYQIPLNADGTAWYGSFIIDSTFEQGEWIFDGVSVETTNGQDLFDNNPKNAKDANFTVTGTSEELRQPEYRLTSASISTGSASLGQTISLVASFDGESAVAGTVHAYLQSPSGMASKQVDMQSAGSGSWYGTFTVTDDMEPGLWKYTAIQGGLKDGSNWTYNLALEDGADQVATVNINGTHGSATMPKLKTDSIKPLMETIAEVDQEISLVLEDGSDGTKADSVYAYYVKEPYGGIQYQVELTYDEENGKWTGTIPASELTLKGYWRLAGIQVKSGDKEKYYHSDTYASVEDKTAETVMDLSAGDFFVGELIIVDDIETEMPYDTNNHRPVAVVHPKRDLEKTLKEGTDYTVAYYGPDGNVIPATDYENGMVDAGTYKMVVTGIGEVYDGNIIEKTWEITKIPIAFTTTPNGMTKTYNAAEQTLVTEAKGDGIAVEDGVAQAFYTIADEAPAKEDDVWSKEIPTKIDADTYNVYYWVKGDKNHLDTEVTKTERDAVINKFDILVVPQAEDKVYDGTTEATVYIDDKVGAGEEFLTFSNVKGEYTTPNVSAGTKVTITNKDEIVIVVEGGQGKVENYNVVYNLDEAYATITPRPLTMEVPQTAIHYSKSYDGTTDAQIDSFLVDTGFGGDVIRVSGLTAVYAQKDVGEDISITIPNIESATIEGIEGTRKDNYDIAPLTAGELKGEITTKRALISAKDLEMEYGDSIPTFELDRVEDFVVNEAKGIDETPKLGEDYYFSCSATSLSAPGYYVINVVINDTDLMKNYSIINSRGVLTINQGETYTVRFDSNGADEGVMDDQVIRRDVATPLNANQFKRDGYTFLGWSTERKATAPSLSNEAVVKNLTERAGRITLYAVWHDNTEELPDEDECYRVVYNANGGTDGVMVSQLIERDKSTKLAKNIFTREGWTFLGWSDDKDAKAESLKDAAYVLNLADKGETITLYAIWSQDPEDIDPEEGYTIKFDSNGGEGSMSNQVIDLNKSTTLSKNLFKKEGYRFLGWAMYKEATSAQLSDQAVVTQLGESGETIVLYAVWQDASEEPIDPEVDGYTIKFEANGGVGMMADQIVAVNKGTKLSKNVFKRTGYTFWGWSTDPDSTAVSLGDQQEIMNIAPAGKTITLYAVWWDDSAPMPDPDNSYVIHYDSNGGTGSMADQTIDVDTTTRLATNMFIRDGFTFLGWSPYADVTVPSLTNGAEVTHLAEKGKTVVLYAIWKEGTVEPITEGYTIHYDANGGTGTMSDQVVATNKVTYLAKNMYTKDGYRFLGWSISKDAKVASLTDNQKVSSMANAGETVTLYAVWQSTSEDPIDETKTYTVRFDPNGGKGTMARQKIEVGVTTNLALCTFIPFDGYEFLGWSPDPDATDASLLDGAEVKDLAKQGGVFKLFAVWKLSDEPPAPTQMYTVKFDANGGNGTMNSQTIELDKEDKLLANIFTKEGNSFLGWSKDKNATNPDYKDCAYVTNLATGGKSVTLYAVWESIYAKATKAPVTKAGLVYDGTQQDLLSQGEAHGGTLVYGVSSTSDASDVTEWSENIPQATNAGTYNIFYYVKGDETHVDSEVSELQTVVIDKRKAEVTVDESNQSTDAEKGRVDVNKNSATENSESGSSDVEKKAQPRVTVNNLAKGDKLTADVDYTLTDVASTSSAKYEVVAQETDAMSNYELTPASDTVVVKNVPASDSAHQANSKSQGVDNKGASIVGVSFVTVIMIAGAVAFIVARKRKKDEIGQ